MSRSCSSDEDRVASAEAAFFAEEDELPLGNINVWESLDKDRLEVAGVAFLKVEDEFASGVKNAVICWDACSELKIPNGESSFSRKSPDLSLKGFRIARKWNELEVPIGTRQCAISALRFGSVASHCIAVGNMLG